MKTPLLWSCLALLGILLAWLLWSGRDELVADRDSTSAQGQPGLANTQTQDTQVQTQVQEKVKDNPLSEDSRQRVEAAPPRSMRIQVLYKADRTPVVGAIVTGRETAATAQATPQATTDATGTVLIPRRHYSAVEATYGDMWGALHVSATSKEPFEILLEKDHDLRARVCSESTGAPVAGVFVGLRRFSLYGIVFEAALERTASPDGIATFHHVQRFLNKQGRWQVFLGVPVRKQSFAPLSMAELPTAPVELVLPDTGTVLVVVHDETEAPVDGRKLRCELSVYPTEGRVKPMAIGSYWPHRPIDEHGMARLSPIGVGLFLRIRVSSNERGSRHRPVTVDFVGPKRPGETVTCEVLWRSDKDPTACYPVVVGRLVHRDGSPWPKAKIGVYPQIFPTPRSSPSTRDLQLTAEGRFRLVLKEPCPAGGKRIYRFWTVWTDGQSRFGDLEARVDLSRKLPPGETDIGDVVLDRGELFVSGQVVDADGRPLPKARLYITQLVITDKGKDYWPGVDCVGSHGIAADGSFALHAIPGMELPTGRLRLEVRCQDLVSAKPVEFLMGSKGLRIVLQSGGGLRGSIRLGEGQSADDVWVVVQAGGDNYSVSMAKDGSFHGQGLPPVPVTVVAFLSAGGRQQRRASRVEIKDVMIRSRETNEDPRIQGISLGDRSPGAQVEVYGEGGEPVLQAIIRRLDGKGGGTTYTDYKGQCIVHAEKFPVEAVVSGFGFAEKRVSLKAGKNKVVLARGLTIELHTKAPTIGKDPDYHLGFMIYQVDLKTGGVGGHVYGQTFPYDRRCFDAGGKASIPLPGPGTYEVRPWVYISGKDNIGRGGTVSVSPFPRIAVVAGKTSQQFEIDIPAGALADTVQRYSK